MPLRPAAERAADPRPPDVVADDVAEQTASADDAMTMEEREGVGLGAGDAALVPDDDGARRGGCAAQGTCAGCAGAGPPAEGAGRASGAGRARRTVWRQAGGRSLCNMSPRRPFSF